VKCSPSALKRVSNEASLSRQALSAEERLAQLTGKYNNEHGDMYVQRPSSVTDCRCQVAWPLQPPEAASVSREMQPPEASGHSHILPTTHHPSPNWKYYAIAIRANMEV